MKRRYIICLMLLSVVLYGCVGDKALTVYARGGKKNSVQVVFEAKDKKGGSTQSVKNSQLADFIEKQTQLTEQGFSIQAGAFSVADNAAVLSNMLEDQGLDPFYFKDKDGLYKVRFGNFDTKESALAKAKELQKKNTLTEYYIVTPYEYTTSKVPTKGVSYLRSEIVRSSKGYIGVPYKWGGNTKSGIDCSGLTQAVYNLNGLSIPRNSREQYKKGSPVNKSALKEGDLVFFATSGGRTVSHVGIYIGNGQFIHAPSKGKKVTIAKLSDKYFTKTYVGARSYIKG